MNVKRTASRPDCADSEEMQIEALVERTPLATAVLAAFTGQVGRRWTLGELGRKLQALGFGATSGQLVVALGQLEAHLIDNAFLPWMLVERGNEWFLVPKSPLLAAVEGAPGLVLGRELTDEEKAVLLVVIGHRRRGGVSKTRLSEILPLKVERVLVALAEEGLVRVDREAPHELWRARPSALLALGLRSHTEIPELKELEGYFEARHAAPAQHRFDAGAITAKRRERRRRHQAQTLPSPTLAD